MCPCGLVNYPIKVLYFVFNHYSCLSRLLLNSGTGTGFISVFLPPRSGSAYFGPKHYFKDRRWNKLGSVMTWMWCFVVHPTVGQTFVDKWTTKSWLIPLRLLSLPLSYDNWHCTVFCCVPARHYPKITINNSVTCTWRRISRGIIILNFPVLR